MNPLHCPKCCGRNIYPEQDRHFDPDPWILVCHTCGYRLYGEESIRSLIQRQAPALAKLLAAKMVPRRQAESQARRAEPVLPKAAESPRRGRVMVHCALCGLGIWRRPYDVRSSTNKRFFCSLEHLTEFKRQEGEEAPRGTGAIHATGAEASSTKREKRQQRGAVARRGALMVNCAVCNAGVWRRPWDVKSCKSGLFFCCTEHRLQHLRAGQIMPGHMAGMEAAS